LAIEFIGPGEPDSVAVQRLLATSSPSGFDEEGREMVSWVDGTVPTPGTPALAITADALESIGALISDSRDAVFSYPNHADDSWFHTPPVPEVFSTTGVIGHYDVDFGNVVFRDHHALALIDFDFAGPSDRVWEVAVAAYYLVPVGRQGRYGPFSAQ
jgi:hypothetical protein